MQLYAKTEEAIQSVLAARAAQEKVAPALEGNSADAVKAQAEVVDKLAEDYVASMVATGATLVQIISEPTKPLSKLVTLHNIMEHSEGPPNQPMRDVYAKVAAEIDEGSATFKTALDKEMAKFDKLAGS